MNSPQNQDVKEWRMEFIGLGITSLYLAFTVYFKVFVWGNHYGNTWIPKGIIAVCLVVGILAIFKSKRLANRSVNIIKHKQRARGKCKKCGSSLLRKPDNEYTAQGYCDIICMKSRSVW